MEQLFGFPEFYPRNSARESRAVFRAWSRKREEDSVRGWKREEDSVRGWKEDKGEIK